MIARGQSIVILTGAGISAESGLDTFRDQGGIWAKHRIEDVATPEAFHRQPAIVHDFYNQRRRALNDARVQPNDAHRALAKLQRAWHGGVTLVTQNVDDLHEKGGARDCLHIHGELAKARCTACGVVMDWRDDVTVETICPSCFSAGTVRPHIVWFGEMPMYMDEIERALESCALFVSIGTSGHVYPAAGFVAEARANGARTVELNLEPSQNAHAFHDAAYGTATTIVPAFVERLLSQI